MGQVEFDTVTSLVVLSLTIAFYTGLRMYKDKDILEFMESTGGVVTLVHAVRILIAVMSDMATLMVFQFTGENVNPISCLFISYAFMFVLNTVLGGIALRQGIYVTYLIQSKKYENPEDYLKHIEEKAGKLGGLQF